MDRYTRVLVADDHARSRSALRALLATYPSTRVISEAANGCEAVRLVEECQPDVVLMDIRMPLLDGLEATRLIKGRWPEIKVIVLTVHTHCEAQVLAAGADRFLIKGCPTSDLLDAIQWARTKIVTNQKQAVQPDNHAQDRQALHRQMPAISLLA
jgi:DNA-binding NarL/FixJ family response regulator